MANYAPLLGKVWEIGRRTYQVVSETLASGKTPFEVVEIQNSEVAKSFAADPTLSSGSGQLFRILRQNPGQTYHVICCLSGNTTVSQSIFRSTHKGEILAVCQRFEAQRFLFDTLIGNDNDKFVSLVKVMHDHPNWHSIHYVAHMNAIQYLDYLSGDPDLKSLLDIHSNPEGLLPLHVACEQGSVDFIRRLVSLGADISKSDQNKQNAMHHAALSSTATVVMELSKSPQFLGCLNAKNDAGYTPLFLAIRKKHYATISALLKVGASADEPCNGKLPLQESVNQCTETDLCSIKCVQALVSHCPKLVSQQDPESGDTPLHKATRAEILEALIGGSSEVNVNVTNKLGQSPLYLFVARAMLSCAVKILAHGADPNTPDIEMNTPLHVAAKNGSLDMVKALLIFGAKPDRVNKNGKSALEFASQCRDKTLMTAVTQCIKIYTGQLHIPLTSTSHAFEEFAQALAISNCVKTREASKGKRINLLSLDGGGIRGLVLIQILMHLEHAIGIPLIDRFKWIGGTSTGAILGIALSLGKSLRECQRLYFRFKDQVFQGSRPYNTNVLENFLKDEIGVEKSMADITSRRLTVTTVIADKQPTKLLLFRNYRLPLSSEENLSLGFMEPQSQSLWKAARCSSAAPTYFSMVDEKYVDGGLIANNPTMDLLTEVNRNNTAAKFVDQPEEVIDLGCVLSVGTGQTPTKPISSESMNLNLPNSFFDGILKVFATRELLNLFVDQVTAADGRPVENSRAWCNSLGIPYFRFSTHLSDDIALNEIADDKLIKMLWETEIYMRQEKNHVQALVDLLKCDIESELVK